MRNVSICPASAASGEFVTETSSAIRLSWFDTPALYAAKRDGRDQVRLERPLSQPDFKAARTEPLSGLRGAMDAIQIVGQPRSEPA